jgi:hypothetical protein
MGTTIPLVHYQASCLYYLKEQKVMVMPAINTKCALYLRIMNWNKTLKDAQVEMSKQQRSKRSTNVPTSNSNETKKSEFVP